MRAVLERDFLSEASRPRAFRARTYLGVLVAMAVAMVVAFRHDDILLSPDKVAASVFRVGGAVLVVVLALLAPALVVGAILAERTQGTLPLLLASPIGPVRLALAKLLSRSALLLGWGMAALLPLGLSVLFGGVSWREVLGLVGLCTAVVVDLSAWSLWISCSNSRPATASILAYLLPAGRWAACVAAGTGLARSGYTGEGTLLFESTPIPAFLDLVDPGSAARWTGPGPFRVFTYRGSSILAFPPGGGAPPELVALATALVLALVFVLASGMRLRRESDPREPKVPLVPWRRRRLRLPPAGNPMAWKEGRLLSTGASRPLYYGVLLLFLLVEILFVASQVRERRLEGNLNLGYPYPYWGHAIPWIRLFATGSAILCLVAAVVGATAISHERALGTWDLVRASPLTGRQIVGGKLLGILRGLGFLALVPASHLCIGVGMGSFQRSAPALAGTLLLADLLLFWTAVGMVCGAFARPGRALTVAVLVFSAFLLGLPLVDWLLEGLWVRHGLEGGPGEVIGCGNPWTMVSTILQGIEEPGFWHQGYYYRQGREDAYPLSLAWAGLLVPATLLLLFLLARRLNRDRDTG